MALRDSLGFTQRRITSTMSSSGRSSRLRSSHTSVSSSAESELSMRFGLELWSLVVCRPRQRRMVVSLTPISAASSATEAVLAWM
jgi:hypothetical protein